MSSKPLIESIARGAEKLIAENRRLGGEVEKLEAARGKLREENQRLTTQAAVLERQLAVKQLVAGFAGKAGGVGGVEAAERAREAGINGTASGLDRHGVKIARARVNRLLREVDKCIVLLNKE